MFEENAWKRKWGNTKVVRIIKNITKPFKKYFRSEFRCENEQCISKLLVCDGIADCEDGSDEWVQACNLISDTLERNKRATG